LFGLQLFGQSFEVALAFVGGEDGLLDINRPHPGSGSVGDGGGCGIAGCGARGRGQWGGLGQGRDRCGEYSGHKKSRELACHVVDFELLGNLSWETG
jgi:hypothetical protein